MSASNPARTSGVSLDGKVKLPVRVQESVEDLASIVSQVVRDSKSAETLNTAAKNFALQESAVQNTHTNLKRLENLTAQLDNQAEQLEPLVEQLSDLQATLSFMS